MKPDKLITDNFGTQEGKFDQGRHSHYSQDFILVVQRDVYRTVVYTRPAGRITRQDQRRQPNVASLSWFHDTKYMTTPA